MRASVYPKFKSGGVATTTRLLVKTSTGQSTHTLHRPAKPRFAGIVLAWETFRNTFIATCIAIVVGDAFLYRLSETRLDHNWAEGNDQRSGYA